jgi:hypothetical protein
MCGVLGCSCCGRRSIDLAQESPTSAPVFFKRRAHVTLNSLLGISLFVTFAYWQSTIPKIFMP